MKKLIIVLVLIGAALTMAFTNTAVLKFVAHNFIYNKEVLVQSKNEYYKSDHYSFVEKSDNLFVENKQDVLNILFTNINNGEREFHFFCAYTYDMCEDHISKIAKDPETLTNINNFVHPFNTYESLRITINGLGRVTVVSNPLYTDEQIEEINLWVDNVLEDKVNDNMSLRRQLLTIHDHIIRSTTYDNLRADAITRGEKILGNHSHIAYGIVSEGRAVCGGYTDLMAIFLERFGINNFKISSEDHIWNYVEYNGEWFHLDLTWNDPQAEDGRQILLHDFFLITTEDLEAFNTGQHIYDKNVFTLAN